ncbi:1586_t:CDS:2 [Rhizophagus irregularis]|nr:1586_t:CDS:2 [Rhizophagus irregularis]
MAYAKELKTQNISNINSFNISVLAASRWSSEPDEVKQAYKDISNRVRQLEIIRNSIDSNTVNTNVNMAMLALINCEFNDSTNIETTNTDGVGSTNIETTNADGVGSTNIETTNADGVGSTNIETTNADGVGSINMETINTDGVSSANIETIKIPFPPQITAEEVLDRSKDKERRKAPNNFIIYRMALAKELKSQNISNINLINISALAALKWNNEPDEVKQAYKDISDKIRDDIKISKIYEWSS